MPLTADELELAAAVIEGIEPGSSIHWYILSPVDAGLRRPKDARDVALLVNRYPEELDYTAPEVQIAARRDALTAAGILRAYDELAAFVGRQGLSYWHALRDDRPALIKALREPQFLSELDGFVIPEYAKSGAGPVY